MKYSDRDLRRMRDIAEHAGYRDAADAFGTTPQAVRCALKRASGAWGDQNAARKRAAQANADTAPKSASADRFVSRADSSVHLPEMAPPDELQRRRDNARAFAATVSGAPPPPPPPKDVLDRYTARQSAKAEGARVRVLERDLYEARQVIGAMGALTGKPLEPVRRYEKASGLREGCAVALLSDGHAEEIVRPGETPVGNEYNPEIAERSIARFFAGYRWLIDFHRTAFRITDATLWIGGDLMTGHIHEENVETTETAPIETLLWLRPRLIAGIDLLLEDSKLERLHVPCSYGNHGRNTKKPFRARGAAHSYEWLLYQFLAEHYRSEPRVRFLADACAHQYTRIYDFDMHWHHGDEAKFGGGVGGITIPLNKAVARWDVARHAHYHNFGHFHQYMDTGRVAVNGSVIGFNAYAMSIGASPEPAQQSFYIIDSKRGKTCKSPIWVRDSEGQR